jgi:hypothetical protein
MTRIRISNTSASRGNYLTRRSIEMSKHCKCSKHPCPHGPVPIPTLFPQLCVILFCSESVEMHRLVATSYHKFYILLLVREFMNRYNINECTVSVNDISHEEFSIYSSVPFKHAATCSYNFIQT